jgi:Fe-S cluster assembly iron-binding protein IscA
MIFLTRTGINQNQDMKVTQKALEELSKALENGGNALAGIRIFSQEGCCGPGIQMVIADRASTGDKEIVIDNVRFFVDEAAEKMLEDVTMDFGANGFKLEGLKRTGGCC